MRREQRTSLSHDILNSQIILNDHDQRMFLNLNEQLGEAGSVWMLGQKGEETNIRAVREFNLEQRKSLATFEVVAYFQLPEVGEINEVFNFLVTGHQSAAGDVGKGGGDVGKGGESVHPRGTNLERKDFLRKSVLWLLTPSSGIAKL